LTRCRCVGLQHTCGLQNVQGPNVVYVGQGGPKGVQGTQGVQGPAGAGAQGVQGAQGPAGPGSGAQGTQGLQGSQGLQGTTGTGTQGATGAQGIQGLQGTDGGGVTLQQLNDAIAGSALGSTDDLSEGTTNLYFRTSRVAYIHTQGASSSTWTINHNLGFYPNLTVQDSAGTIYEGEISYTNSDSLTVTFSSAFSGTAYLS